jgi:signal peptidase
MKNLIENVKLVFSMIIIGGLLLYIGTLLFMPELTVKIFKFQPYIVVTESMEPVFNVNDMVIIGEFDIDEAEVGDIITFQADIDYNGTKEIVTHYIYEIDNSGSEAIIRTHRHFEEGETVSPDTWLIPASDVIGSYRAHIPYIGNIIGFIKSPYGIAVILVNAVIIGSIVSINKKIAKRDEELKGSFQLKDKETQES